MMKDLHVVAALIIDEKGRVFAAQKANEGDIPLKWEFPGGKVEKGETKEDALVREIKEEFTATIQVDHYVMTVAYDFPSFHLVMDVYQCHHQAGTFILKEHLSSAWLEKCELQKYDWGPADRIIVEGLLHNKG